MCNTYVQSVTTINMKKISMIFLLSCSPFALLAQNSEGEVVREFLHIGAVLLAVYMLYSIIIVIIKTSLDHKLKSKMVEKGVSENVAEQFLRPRNTDITAQAFKWALMLAGAGVGLTLVYYTLPVDIHSIAIMAFSLAFSFLMYFLYLKKQQEK
jgi:hypothetical protein